MEGTTRVDPCVELVESHPEADSQQLVQLLVKYAGLAKRTPRERIVAAVADEVRDLTERACRDLGIAVPADGVFPREQVSPYWAGKYDAFARRVGWLTRGTPPAELATLDPVQDCDQIFHAVSTAFRVEARLLDLLTILRIAQSSAVSLFFRSTREAEDNAVSRFHDTMGLFANFFEWGEDSRRGRGAVARINEIHGRYYLPNAGLKFVLLDGPFTWIEGAERIGHRPLTDVERRGYFHAYVKLGRAMHIAELTDDYDEMYAWFLDFAQANTAPHPLKRDTFERIALNSLESAAFPGVPELLLTAANVGMHHTYRQAVGYPEPSAAQREKVRGVFFTLGALAELLPPQTFVRSLQNNPARPRESAPPEQLGVGARSPHLPVLTPGAPNGGFPEGQLPIRHDADVVPVALPVLDWDEIGKHTTEESLWVVLSGEVYDLTDWARLHPGGLPILLRHAGTDATEAFEAEGHSAATKVFRLNYRIGRVAGSVDREGVA